MTAGKDRDIMARTLWGEARGEGLFGQIVVTWTIRNRVFDGKAGSWRGRASQACASRSPGSSDTGTRTTPTVTT